MYYEVTVRYGSMGFVATFTTELSGLKRGERIVVKTDRGSESGEVVRPPATIDSDKRPSNGEVLRVLTVEDEKELARISDEAVPKEMAFCRERIKALDLPMKLVAAEHLLGGEKIIFYFLADGRVDFRQLVKDIAREYKTRIELRQIGVRDEARLLAELGHCGQGLCCRSFIKSLEPVTMRMAKSQKATLDPAKISGVCGRLMCCLRYEDKIYSELKSKLPKRGVMITTKKATGKVIDTDILSQTVSIRTANANIVRVKLDEIVSVESEAGAKAPSKDRPPRKVKSADAKEKGETPKSTKDTRPPRQGRRRRGGRGGRRRGGAGKQE